MGIALIKKKNAVDEFSWTELRVYVLSDPTLGDTPSFIKTYLAWISPFLDTDYFFPEEIYNNDLSIIFLKTSYCL